METSPGLWDCEVAVVGGGIHGTCAALKAATAGSKTILLDQFPLPHNRGSSAGKSRITRLANNGARELNPIMKDAYLRWEKIERESGTNLFISAPLVSVGYEEAIEKTAGAIREANIEPEILSASEVNKRFRARLPEDLKAVVDNLAGVLKADKCISHLQTLFRKAGGKVLDNWPVTSIKPGTVVTLSGKDGRVRARKLILCTGAWTAKVLEPLGVNLPLRPEKTAQLFWKVKDPDFPVFTYVDTSYDPNPFYMLPSLEYPGYVKVGCHAGSLVDPDKRDLADVSYLKTWVKDYLRETFPGIEPVCAIEEWCIYQTTPDEEMIVDRHPSHSNIVFATGFSGTGFKIAPTIGDVLYRMVMDLPPEIEVSYFSADRFLRKAKM